MTSTGNKAKLVDSVYCQCCAKCCREFNMTCDTNLALRFMWMDERKIKAKDTPFQLPFSQGVDEQVKFKYSCTQLEQLKDGKYACKKWNSERPDFCNTYPDHIFYDVEVWNKEKIQKLLDESVIDCPGLKLVTVDNVINMLKERRGN